MPLTKQVLVTGAGGYVGGLLIAGLAADRERYGEIVALDVRPIPESQRLNGIQYLTADIRSDQVPVIMQRYRIDCVVHLASMVTPDPDLDREIIYAVDVLGTRNVLDGCLAAGVRQVIVTSSGAAYGYYADNPPWLDETDALRGNPEFAYSDHKRQVEELLARYRQRCPQLKQLVLRPGTILGKTAQNQITALFHKPVILGIGGSASPFVFIWDQDVVSAIMSGIRTGHEGIYNLAGDGTLTLRQIARLLKKPYLPLPPGLLSFALGVLKPLGLTRYGPEQIGFLRYRPVLSNKRLKTEFNFTPCKTTRETFTYYLNHHTAKG